MQTTLDQTLNDNTKIVFEIGFFCMIACVVVSLLALVAVMVDFKGREGVLKKFKSTTTI